MTIRSHLIAPVALAAALLLAGCGSDDAASTSNPAPQIEPGAVPTTLDELTANIDPTLDQIGSAIETVLDDATGYEVEGQELRVSMDKSKENDYSTCTIVSTVMGSFDVPADATITIVYNDGEVECER